MKITSSITKKLKINSIFNNAGWNANDSHLKSSAASSSLAKQRSMLPDSSSFRSGSLKFLTIFSKERGHEWEI